MALLALDIGGANLKAADGRGYAEVRPFALWRAPGDLRGALRALIAAAPPCDRLVATMTGELCDCFSTKAEGVRAIVEALVAAAEGRPTTVYLTDGRFVDPEVAFERPLLAAASNWRALAEFAVRYAEGKPAILIDIGSTTADLIPLTAAGPAAVGATDPERLAAGELVYTGVERTPLCAVASHLPWRGGQCPVAAELFATTVDAYLLLGDLAEEPASLETADGRPRTRCAAHARLARMICADATMFTETEACEAAIAVRDAQVRMLQTALCQVRARSSAPPERVILSGQGEFLARRLFDGAVPGPHPLEIVSLTERLGPQLSRAAPAHALAVLANEQL
jgi:probable H4MPT-linked C1 transfer pathway protein